MRDFYHFTMTYDLPQHKGEKQTLTVPDGAEVLLDGGAAKPFSAQRRALMVKTALPAGYPLSGTTADQQFWQRVNLPAAFYQMAKKAH